MFKVEKALKNGLKWNLTPKEYSSFLEGSGICLCENPINNEGNCNNCHKRI